MKRLWKLSVLLSKHRRGGNADFPEKSKGLSLVGSKGNEDPLEFGGWMLDI